MWGKVHALTGYRGYGKITFLMLIALGILWTQAVQAQVENETLSEAADMAIAVSNDTQKTLQIRLVDRAQRVFINEQLEPGESSAFYISRATCLQVLEVFINEKYSGRLKGHLCPEIYPDEQKSIFFVKEKGSVLALILHEDRM